MKKKGKRDIQVESKGLLVQAERLVHVCHGEAIRSGIEGEEDRQLVSGALDLIGLASAWDVGGKDKGREQTGQQ